MRLSVEDSGPGLAEADLARLGERFFRVIGSGQSGSGLGWSIVRRIAAAHQAKVGVGRSSELGGLAVTVDWPALKLTTPEAASPLPLEGAPLADRQSRIRGGCLGRHLVHVLRVAFAAIES